MSLFPKKRPWYADGLAFECSECGRCCSGPEEGYVWITADEIRAAAEFLRLPVEQFTARYAYRAGRRMSLREKPGNADCVFLEPDADGNKRCTIYPVRPTQCRTWPFWSMNVSSPDAWAQAGQRCQGINRGRTHDLEHIERQKNRTR